MGVRERCERERVQRAREGGTSRHERERLAGKSKGLVAQERHRERRHGEEWKLHGWMQWRSRPCQRLVAGEAGPIGGQWSRQEVAGTELGFAGGQSHGHGSVARSEWVSVGEDFAKFNVQRSTMHMTSMSRGLQLTDSLVNVRWSLSRANQCLSLSPAFLSCAHQAIPLLRAGLTCRPLSRAPASPSLSRLAGSLSRPPVYPALARCSLAPTSLSPSPALLSCTHQSIPLVSLSPALSRPLVPPPLACPLPAGLSCAPTGPSLSRTCLLVPSSHPVHDLVLTLSRFKHAKSF